MERIIEMVSELLSGRLNKHWMVEDTSILPIFRLKEGSVLAPQPLAIMATTVDSSSLRGLACGGGDCGAEAMRHASRVKARQR